MLPDLPKGAHLVGLKDWQKVHPAFILGTEMLGVSLSIIFPSLKY